MNYGRAIAPLQPQYQFNAPHILLLEEKVAKMRTLWYASSKGALVAEWVKVAAIAIRALEEVRVTPPEQE